MSAASTCPTCKGPRKPYPENKAFPFCSSRCKLADLDNWLGERYRVASEPSPFSTEDELDDAQRRLN
jgi:endogenous inhibitor of DNA gyrase (YacG/DUF329 family)